MRFSIFTQLESLKSFFQRLFRRHWFLLCGGPVLILLLYQLYKGKLSWNFAANLGRPDIIHWGAVIILIIALVWSLLLVLWHSRWGRWLPVLVAISSLIGTIGVWFQKDRNLLWVGADVPTNNYQAAMLTLEIGLCELVATWNARANPYVKTTEIPHPEEVIKKIEQYGLMWIIGTRWQRLDLPQDNNRMQQHPPGYPIALAGWLRIFGKNRAHAVVFELFIKFCLVIFTIIWAYIYIPKSDTLNRVAIGLLLSTAPPILLFFEPHANELASLFAVFAFILGINSCIQKRFLFYIPSGIFLAAAAYTNFFHMILLIIVIVVLVLSKLSRRLGLTQGIMMGVVLVVSIFVILGYYPWLTIITGTQVTHYYHLNHPFDLSSSIFDILYFGFPLLLIATFSFFEFKRLRNEIALPWMIAVMFALVIGLYQAFGLAATSRYLMGLFFLLMPLFTLAMADLSLSKKQTLMIPLVNFAFVFLVLFL